MPWVRASLHGKEVYARASADGSLAASGGRVDVCYRTGVSKLYQARASNLAVPPGAELLPDDTCAPEAAADKPAGEARAKAGAKGKKAHTPAAVPEGAVIVYADGACSGNPGPAGLGVVVLDGAARVEISEYLGTGTNNIAELAAIARALDEVPDATRHVVIHTDSSYAIGVLSRGWKAKANLELVATIRARLVVRPARLVYVPGHSGVPLNERADELAREAVVARGSRRQAFA